MLDTGELGKVLQVNVHGTFGLSSNGSHAIDTVRYLAGGEVEWVFGEMASDDAAASDDDPQGNGYLAFDNGVRAYVRSMPSGAAIMDVDVIAEKGIIRSSWHGGSWELIRLENSSYESHGQRPLSRRFPGPIAVKYPFPWPTRIQGIGLAMGKDT